MKTKIHLIYLKNDSSLYAYTTEDDYLEMFLKQRNEKCFRVKTKKMSENELRTIMYANKRKKLMICPFDTMDKENISMVVTADEDVQVTFKLEEFDRKRKELERLLNNVRIKDKYKKLLMRLVDISDKKDNKFTVDELSLLVDLHLNTFIEPHKIPHK